MQFPILRNNRPTFLTSLLTSLMRRKVGSELTLKNARLPNGSLADQCFPSDEESRPRTSKLFGNITGATLSYNSMQTSVETHLNNL